MNVLLIDDFLPYDHLGAGFPRARHVLDALSESATHVTFCATRQYGPLSDLPDFRVAANTTVQYATEGNMAHRWLTSSDQHYDLVWISRTPNLIDNIDALRHTRNQSHRPHIVFDLEALASERERIKCLVLGDMIDAEQLVQQRDRDLEAFSLADTITTVSPREQAYLESAGMRDVRVLGHCLNARPGPSAYANRDKLLFVGAIHNDATPNADSLRWFTSNVLPLLREDIGQDLTLSVVGLNKSPSISALNGHGLQLEGVVEDLAPLCNQARVFVAPTRFAAGVPLKAYHAAAHGLPMVTTELLASQLGWQHGIELLAAANAERFTACVSTLWRDSQLWNSIRSNALRAVERDCSPLRFQQTVTDIVSLARLRVL